MANFFKEYTRKYQEKHKGEEVEDMTKPKLADCTAPDPRTLGNNKKKSGEDPDEESEENKGE